MMDEVFSRKMRVSCIGTTPVTRSIAAASPECAGLAALFGLPGIARLSGDFTLNHQHRGVIDGQLRLNARVTQICVVSLEPFEANIAEDARLRFVPAASVRETKDGLLDAETLEGPDEIPYAGDTIDLGVVLAEQLALALDPYPRKPGAELQAGLDDGAASPFAALCQMKTKPAADN